MPLVIWALAPGFADDAYKMELTVTIARIMFFYVIFICGSAFLSAVLNAHSRFILAAFMPVMLNIMLIGALISSIWYGAKYGNQGIIYVMAVTVVLSGIIQFFILWQRIRAKHFGLRLIIPHWNTQIKNMFKRFGVSLLGSGFYQITIIVGTLVASFQSGAVSWLYYSDRIVQLPFAIIGLAVGTVLMSSISNALAEKNMRSVHIQQNSSMRRSMMLIIPCVIGLFILAEPIIQFLFQYGEWTTESTKAVATAIQIQCLVLPAMLISQIYSKTLYASQDVKTPVRTSMVSLGIAAIIYVSLFKLANMYGFENLAYLSIPVGIVISGYVKNYLLGHVCRKRGLVKTDRKTVLAISAFTIIAAALGFALKYIPMTSIWMLGIAICGFGILYLPTAYIVDRYIIK